MHSKFRKSLSLKEVLGYHERKVKKGMAECIYSGNMIREADELTRPEKEFYIGRLQELNERIERKTLQIFLSFHESDKPDKARLQSLARDYMKGMGWEKQPYVVYRHQDAPHEHVHIVTSRIRPDGSGIDVSRRLYEQSARLSRELEQRYGLYQAGIPIPDKEWEKLHPIQAVEFGVTPLKPAMNAVLNRVIPNYNYTSLEELNAVLGLYRIRATMGRENTATQKHKGLLYVPLNKEGEEEHAYIKASVLKQKPTLAVLEQRFTVNRELRQQLKERVTGAIDWTLAGDAPDFKRFTEQMGEERISVVLQNTAEQKVWYVDHASRVVYDGESLGRRYDAKAILERCIPEEVYQQKLTEKLTEQPRLRINHYL
jgi:hypothetical protein